MKWSIIFVILFLSTSTCLGQDFIKVDKKHQMFSHYYDRIFLDSDREDGKKVIFLAEHEYGNDISNYFYLKFKKLDGDYNTLKEVIIDTDIVSLNYDMFKCGKNYMVVIPYYEQVLTGVNMLLYNEDLQLMDTKQIIFPTIDSHIITRVAHGISKQVGEKTMYVLLYLIKPPSKDHVIFKEMIIEVDKLGEISVKDVITSKSSNSVIPWPYQKVLQVQDNYVVIGPNILKFDSNFNLIGQQPNVFKPAEPLSNHLYIDDDYDYLNVGYEYSLNDPFPTFSIIRYDRNFVEKSKKVVDVKKWVNENDYFFALNSPTNALFRDKYGDFNYYSSSVYFYHSKFGNRTDTLQSEFQFMKFDSSMQVKCAKVYRINEHKLQILDIYPQNDGVLIFGNIDTIEKSKMNVDAFYAPFYASVTDGCDIKWATTVFDAIPLSNGELLYVKPIEVWPNPVKDVIYFDSEILKSGNKMVASIYDMQGRQVLNAIHVGDHYIDVAGLMSGAYYLQIHDVKENRSWGSKFIVGE